MGVPAAFCYIDSRITDVYTDAVPRKQLQDWHKIMPANLTANLLSTSVYQNCLDHSRS